MKIALFGGSFDPPHLGHLAVADALVNQKLADEVWFVPCANHPFGKEMGDAKHRLAMLKVMGKHKVYEYELKKSTPSYAIETLEHAVEQFPNHSFSWVIGSDQVAEFHRCHRYHDILNNFTVYVYPREGYETETALPGMILLSGKKIALSSTEVRAAVKNKQLIREMVPQKVDQYIQRHNLYV
jgi:nicotinate-nucleotide adenylyltransferase